MYSIVVASFSVLVFSLSAAAQSGGGLFPPTLAGPPGRSLLRINSEYVGDQGLDDSESYHSHQHSVTTMPAGSGLFLSAGYGQTKIKQEPLVLEDGVEVDNNLKSMLFQVGWAQAVTQGSTWSAQIGFGANSDRPFERSDDDAYTVSLMNLRPGTTGRWILGAFYNSNFGFGDFPVPIIGYLYSPSKKFNLIVGAPFVRLSWGGFVGTRLTMGVSPGGASAGLSQSVLGPFAIEARWSWEVENYFHEARLDEDDQFYIQKQQALIGLRAPVIPGGMLRIYYSYRYNSSYYQAESQFDRPEQRFELRDSGGLSTSLSLSY
ncbi:MAG: hypothetical protein CL675_09890 [Bdellovibrionaceae bacterium]|nr:hypothetical protein [Pseudobdellovibrionaceae bacterium]